MLQTEINISSPSKVVNKPIFQYYQNQQIQQLVDQLPQYVDISEQDPEIFEDQLTEVYKILNMIIEQNNKKDINLAYNIIKEYQINSPFESFHKLFSQVIDKYFQNYQLEYISPTISKFIKNEQLPTIEGIRNYIQKQNQQEKEIQSFKNIDNQDESLQQQNGEQMEQFSNNSSMSDIELYEAKIFNMSNSENKTDIQELLTKIFNFFNGKIPRIFNTLLYFPDHLKTIFDSFELIFVEQGPLPFEQVYYLALMTSAATDNLYIFNLFAKLFLDFDGNQDWVLEGYNQIPLKLQQLWEIVWSSQYHPTATNKYSYELFDYLNSSLNQSEIMHALLICNFTDYLISLTFGAGVSELEFQENPAITSIPCNFFPSKFLIEKTTSNESGQSLQSVSTDAGEQDVILEINIINQLNQEQKNNNQQNQECSEEKINQQKQYTQSFVEMLKLNNNLACESKDQNKEKTDVSSEDEENKKPCLSKFQQFGCNSRVFGNKQTKKLKNYISENDFDWKNNLYEYLNELNFSNLANTLNVKLNNIKSMTKQSFGVHKNIDTSKFREVIWAYVEMVLGYKRDNQSYREITNILSQKFRNFLRKLVLRPWELSKQDFDQIPYLLEPQEYMHIVLLTTESKFYTKLLYAFQSQYNFRKNSI